MFNKVRTILTFIMLYLTWTILAIIALVLLLLDPVKQRLVQPMIRLWGKASMFIMRLPVRISGLENLDKTGTAVLVINHTSAIDIPLVLGYLKRRIGFLAKKQVLYIPLIGQLVPMLGHVLVDRSNARKALMSIKKCIKAYEKGINIALFPEGTRSVDGEVQPFKAGSLRVPVAAGAPVLPISLYGGHRVMRKNDLTIHKKPVYMHIGEPISSKNITKDKFKDYVEKLEETVRANCHMLKEQMLKDYPELIEDDKQSSP